MSADTRAALEEALRAHVADEQPDYPLLTDWVLTAASVGAAPSEVGYTHDRSDAPPHVLHGLLTIAEQALSSDGPG